MPKIIKKTKYIKKGTRSASGRSEMIQAKNDALQIIKNKELVNFRELEAWKNHK